MVNTKIRLIVFFSAKDGEAAYSQQKQDRELTVAQIINSLLQKFRLNLKKVVKTARPFRYDLNQILYDYTVEVRCREQGMRKVEKCLQTRLSTRAEHSCKRDVQLRILCLFPWEKNISCTQGCFSDSSKGTDPGTKRILS